MLQKMAPPNLVDAKNRDSSMDKHEDLKGIFESLARRIGKIFLPYKYDKTERGIFLCNVQKPS